MYFHLCSPPHKNKADSCVSLIFDVITCDSEKGPDDESLKAVATSYGSFENAREKKVHEGQSDTHEHNELV